MKRGQASTGETNARRTLGELLRTWVRRIKLATMSRGDRLRAAQFNAAYYLRTNPDVHAAGVDPLLHYITYGWREGRPPNDWFNPSYYLAANPDVRNAGIDPLLHYVLHGAAEGRQLRRPSFDSWRHQLSTAVPPRQRITSWAGAADHSPSMAAAAVARALDSAAAGVGYVLSLSHDDYRRACGGVQNVIGDEERAFRHAGWNYLHVSPAAPLPMLADPTPATDFRVGLRLNGERLGIATFANLLHAVGELRAQARAVECVVHHFMGHAPELVLDLVRASGVERPIVWVHDFFTLCESYALLRNDIAFCGSPPVGSPACGICCYGIERRVHLVRLHAFFDTVRPAVLAPSDVALDLWRSGGGLPFDEAAVVPLARLLATSTDPSGSTDVLSRPLRIAHLGARAFHKGWPIFEELAFRSTGDDKYEFFQLGDVGGPVLPSNIRNIPVQVRAERRNAMVDAAIEARIDVVVAWSLWPETFCFVAHEALAAGAFVLARAGSGNVWPAVAATAPGQGCAVADEAALFALFQGDELRTLVASAPRGCRALLVGGATADWLLQRRPERPPSRAAQSATSLA
jgi:hypothetical protein